MSVDKPGRTVTTGNGASSREDLLTLQEAADHLKVHYMTAYRWVRSGELPAFKAGGRLRIRFGDLEAFVARREVDTVTPRSDQRTDWPMHVARLHQHLRAGSAVEANRLVRKIVADGAPVGDVYVRLLAPALHRIGDDWARGEICVSEEHRAAEIVGTILRRQSEAFRRRGPRRGTAVTLTPPGELHGLGSAMAADFLRGGGYDVDHLGCDVPTDDLAGFLADLPADVACVSVTVPGRAPEIYRDLVRAARGAKADSLVVFGGQGVDEEAASAAGGIAHRRLETLTDAVAQLAAN